MKKFLYLFSFFSFTPIFLLIIITSLLFYPPPSSGNVLINPSGGVVLASATTDFDNLNSSLFQTGTINSFIETADARPLLIKNYLDKYNSPLAPYANYIFNTSQRYGLDYGLIVAIAQCESNVCKKIPHGSYNCWGFGNGESKFRSWESAIEYVAKTLKEDYYDLGLVTPDQIMPKYVPPSVAKGGPWAKCVNQFLEELR